jgi:hypothetical protein
MAADKNKRTLQSFSKERNALFISGHLRLAVHNCRMASSSGGGTSSVSVLTPL